MIKLNAFSIFHSDPIISIKRILLSLPLFIFLFLLLIAGNIWSQLIPFNENFSYPSGNLAGQGGWTLQGADNTNPIQVASPGLFYPEYQASGIGLAVSYGNVNGGQDLFKSFTGTNTINSGSVYIAALVRVNSASRPGDYFLSFKETPNVNLTVFKGRLYAKDTLGSGNLVFGVTKSAVGTSAPVSWTPQYFSFGTTYLVVLKYTFISGTANDTVEVFVCDPEDPFPVTEPGHNAHAYDSGSDGVGQRCVQLRQGAANSPIVNVDGIRVGQTWADAVTRDITAPVATFDPPDGSANVILEIVPTITFNEPVRRTDGSDLINSDLASIVSFNTTSASGTAITFTATIDATKTIITITSDAGLLYSQLYYLAVAPVEDGAGNESMTQSATFTTLDNIISNDANLSDLLVDGTTVEGFAPDIYDYAVVVPYGLPVVPTVTATPNYPLATVGITPAGSLPGTTSILVTAQDGITQLTYTVEFIYAPPSTNSALSYIKWLPNGLDPAKQNIRVIGFESTTFDYYIEVPIETVSIFVDAEPDFVIPASGCPPATYVVTQPVNLTGTPAERTATVVCTAQDGINASTYHVTFSKASASNYYLFKQGFDVMPPAGWTCTSNVGASTGNGMGFYGSSTTYATPKFKWLTGTDGGILTTPACNGATKMEFFVKVLDKNPASNLHLYIEKSYDNSDWTLVSQDPMPLYTTITQWHQVVLPVNDNSPQIYFRFRATAATGNNDLGLFYLDDVSLTMNASVDATLSDLQVDGTSIPGFMPDTVNYYVILPVGTTIVPDVTAIPSQPEADAVVIDASNLPGTTTVLVTASDNVTTKTYYVNFSIALSPPSDLAANLVSSSQVDLSWSDNNIYETGSSIERKPNEGLFAQVATVGADITTFSDPLTELDPDDFIPADRFSGVTVTLGIKFADVINYQGNPTSLYLDVYEPTGDNTAGRPVIIWIHGGGFRTGSVRTQGYIVDYCSRFAKRGYVCMSIDYRLRAAADMPDQASEYPALQDAARDANAAINWVKANAASYNVDPNLIFIAGGSAGGRTTQTVCQFDGPDPTAQYPPENMYLTTPWDKKGLIANATLWGGLEPEMRGWVYPYLQPTDIPTILVHGSADVTILPVYSQDLHDTLTDAGVTSELHIIPGATHSCIGHETEISEWVAAFFAQEWNNYIADVSCHSYRVRAYNAISRSDPSNEVLATGMATWTGNISDNWSTPANWSNNALPTITTQVTIPATGIANFPVVSNPPSAPAEAYSITVENGASITVTGALIVRQP